MIDEPKVQVYDILSAIPGDITVYQERPEVVAVLPAITFIVLNNSPEYTLDRGVGRQRMMIKVDLWANTPEETTQMLKDVEVAMRAADYLLEFTTDIPDPDNCHHVSTQFIY